MILAWTDRIELAADFTQKQLDYAANVSFAAYCLVFLASAVMVLIVIHILFFVRPDAKNRRDCNTKTADAVERLSMSSVVTTQLLEQHEAWHRSHDSRLSRWENEQAQDKLLKRCPLLDRAHEPLPLMPPNMTPIPHGA